MTAVRMRDISIDSDTKTPRGTPRGPANGGIFSFGAPKLFGFKPHIIERERTPPLSKTKLDSPKQQQQQQQHQRNPSSPTPIPRSPPRLRAAEKTPRPGREQSPLTSPRINPRQKTGFFGSTPQPPIFPITPPRDIPPRISTTDRPSKYPRKNLLKPKSRDAEPLDELNLNTTLALDIDDEDELSSPEDSEDKKKKIELDEDEEALPFGSSPSIQGQQRRLSHSSRASSEVSRKHSSTPSTPRQIGRLKAAYLTPGTSPAGIERTVFSMGMGRSPCSEASDRIDRIELDSPRSPSQVHRIHIPAVEGEITFPDPGSAHSSPSTSPTFEWEEQKPARKLAKTSGECTQLLDYLFVGGQNIAQDLEKLKANGITHVVNCAADVCENYHESQFTYLALHLHDSTDEDIISVLYGIIDFIENARLRGGKVFVHCQQGASRSPSVCIGYLMAIREEDFKPIADLLHQHRNISRPNLNFSCQLNEWRRRVTHSVNLKAFLYRVATHSPRDSLLVGKWVAKVTPDSLDERTVFILHSYSLPKTYIFVGAACEKKELYCETAKKVANWLHLYEHAPQEIEWIYSGQAPLPGNTADQFWGIIGPGLEGNCLARSYNKEYDKDYGASSLLPSVSGIKEVEKEEHSCGSDCDCGEFKLDDLPPLLMSTASSTTTDSETESQKRDSMSTEVVEKDLKADDCEKLTQSRKGVRLFEYPSFNVITCYDLSKLDSSKVFVQLLSHSSSCSSTSTSISTSSSTSSSVRLDIEQYYMMQPPTSIFMHVWIGKNFVLPTPSSKTSPISTPSSPSRSLDGPVLSLPAYLTEHSTASTTSDLEIAIESPTSPESPKGSGFLVSFAEHVSHLLQKVIKLKHERTQFHTVLEEEGHESATFCSC